MTHVVPAPDGGLLTGIRYQPLRFTEIEAGVLRYRLPDFDFSVELIYRLDAAYLEKINSR